MSGSGYVGLGQQRRLRDVRVTSDLPQTPDVR